MLGKAPGTELLNEWYGVYNASVDKGMSPEAALLELANHIAASSAFTSMYPFFITNTEFARDFLTAALGEAPSAEVLTLATGLLDGGMGRGEMGLLAVRQLFEIRMQGESHPAYGDFGALAMTFANKVQVATYYTVEKRWEDASSSVLGGVTGDGNSVDMAKEAIDMMRRPGKSFELTTGVDRLDGTLGDDTFVATEKTLTGVDRIDGGEGMDTLELSSSGSDDDVNISSGASVMHVETLTVDSGGDFSADLSDWEGLTDVVLSDVAGDVELDAGGADVMSRSLGDDDKDTTIEIMNAAAIKLEGVSKMADVDLYDTDTTTSIMVEGGKTVDVGKEDAPSATVESVTLDGVRDGMGDDGKRYQLKEGSTVNGETVTKAQSDTSKDSVPVHIYSKAIESVDLRNTNTTLLVQNAAKDMTSLTAMVDKFGNTANGHGKLCLKGIEDLMIEVKGDSNIRLASDQIKTVAVSGAGDLTLSATKFAPAAAEKAADVKPSETLEKLTLSGSGKTTLDAMGLSKLKTVDASEASGAVKLSNLGASVTSYMGSAGKDEVSVTAFAKDGLKADLGAGDDTFTVANVSAGKSRIDGGAGMDTLVLKEKTGANLKGAGSAYMNFETITLEAGEGSGTYDVKGLGVDHLKVTGGTGPGPLLPTNTPPDITFKNLMSGTDLAVSSRKPDSENKTQATVASVSYMLEDGDNDSLMLYLHTDGGTKDEKGDLGVKDEEKKMVLDIALDKDIEELVVRSTAKVTSTVAADNRPKAGDYVNRVVVKQGDGIEEIKVTGDARTFINTTIETITTGFKYDRAGLKSLELVDARESSGGLVLLKAGSSGKLTVEGSPVDDWVVANMNSGDPIETDLKGHNGDDVLVGNSGEDKLTGGAGGDVLVAWVPWLSATFPSSSNIELYLNIDLHFSRFNDNYYHGDFNDSVEDTFIYTAASDSQIKFNQAGKPVSGFDRIFGFKSGADKISLSDVVALEGSINLISNSDMASLKGLMDAKSLDNAFETEASGQSFKEKHVVAAVTTKESADFRVIANSLKPGEADPADGSTNTAEVTVTWVLVDVNGDGDFGADTDMAIALIALEGASFTATNLNASDFI